MGPFHALRAGAAVGALVCAWGGWDQARAQEAGQVPVPALIPAPAQTPPGRPSAERDPGVRPSTLQAGCNAKPAAATAGKTPLPPEIAEILHDRRQAVRCCPTADCPGLC